MDDVVELEIGTDIVTAKIIAAECRSAGFEVRLVSFDQTAGVPGVAASFGQEHRLLVHSPDLSEIQKIIAEAQEGIE